MSLLPGARERCISESFTKLDAASRITRLNAELDWEDPTHTSFNQLDAASLSEHAARHSENISLRGASSDAGEVLQTVRLLVRPRVRDTNPGQRGVSNPSLHQSLSEQFDKWCFELMWKTTHSTGCNKSLVEPKERLFFTECDARFALRNRAAADPRWKDNISENLYKKFSVFIANAPFDDDFLVYMAERGIYRKANPLDLGMNKGQRDHMNRGKTETYTNPSSGVPTPPLRDHPGYSVVRTSDAWSNVPKPPPPVKDKGSGKGKWKGWK